MNYKILAALGCTAAALMALAGSASATTITSPTGTVYTGTITAEADKGASSIPPTIDGSFTTVTCTTSTIAAKVEKHSVGVTVSGNISTLAFTGCNFPVTVIKNGLVEIHPIRKPVSGKAHEPCTSGEGDICTGTVTSTGTELTIATSVGTCTFTTSNTSIGVLTPSGDTGGDATIDVGSSPIPRGGGNFLCGSSATLTGNYTVTSPNPLYLDV